MSCDNNDEDEAFIVVFKSWRLLSFCLLTMDDVSDLTYFVIEKPVPSLSIYVWLEDLRASDEQSSSLVFCPLCRSHDRPRAAGTARVFLRG